MKKHELISLIQEAIMEGKDVEVRVSSPDLPYPEVIVNRTENLPAKMRYYVKAYDGDLKLLANKDISIVSAVTFYNDLGKENYEVKNNG